ncbi:MAG: TetR family transcriptional regulator [Planctomycetes bacterium]|nr:TetR family transcriptional regulator [Planctomycetota bacterium]
MTKPNDTRARLLHTAADLIWRSSYHATGVDRICETAGVKKGSFYHFFASKEELAIAAIDEQWEVYKPRIDDLFASSRPPLDRLRLWAREMIAKQNEKRAETGCVCGCPLFSLGSEIGTQAPKLRAKVEELLATKVAYVEGALRDAHAAGLVQAPDPARKARILVDFVEGAMTRARIVNDLEPLAELEELVLEIVGAYAAPALASSTARASTPARTASEAAEPSASTRSATSTPRASTPARSPHEALEQGASARAATSTARASTPARAAQEARAPELPVRAVSKAARTQPTDSSPSRSAHDDSLPAPRSGRSSRAKRA